MEKKHTRGSFTGSIGFVLAAAGSGGHSTAGTRTSH